MLFLDNGTVAAVGPRDYCSSGILCFNRHLSLLRFSGFVRVIFPSSAELFSSSASSAPARSRRASGLVAADMLTRRRRRRYPLHCQRHFLVAGVADR